jgi:DNA adenine methylase
VRIERRDWKDIVKAYDKPGTFFYLDPPYDAKFVPDLVRVLPGLKGSWLLSFGDNPELARGLAAKGIHVNRVTVTNTIKKPGAATSTLRKELLAANYPIKIPRGLVFKGMRL